MIRSFRNRGTEDVFDGRDTKAARAVCPRQLWLRAQRRLSQLDYASSLGDLRLISISMEYRICFEWTADGPVNVEIADYH